MNAKKVVLGQFFTKNDIWLRPHVRQFILNSHCDVAYDPFAGAGDLLYVAQTLGFTHQVGMDIDTSLQWHVNDSLKYIPHIDNAVIITNPPYISNYSASRKKIISDVRQYYQDSKYNDVYMIALDKMLAAQEYVVAIIPETFINSNYMQKDRLVSITTLENNPFSDTDCPVVVVCFDGRKKTRDEIFVYKNDTCIGSLAFLDNKRLSPRQSVDVVFNDPDGWLGLRAIDMPNPLKCIRFDYKNKIDYNWEKGIKVSSRLYSLISIPVEDNLKTLFIECANRMLADLRHETQDMILSPFKGNTKNGNRRRRLDFKTTRAILERTYDIVVGTNGDINEKQLRLF